MQNLKFWIVLSLFLAVPAIAQTNPNGYSVPTSGIGLSLRLGPGSCITSGGTIVTYAGGTVSVTTNKTTFGYIDSTCTITTNTTGFPSGSIPIFTAIAGLDFVKSIVDSRVNYVVSGAAGSGTVTHTAGALTANLPVIGNGGADITVGTASGNTTKFVTTTGSLTSTHCAQIDASGNFVDSGGVCGTVSSIATTAPITGGTITTTGTIACATCATTTNGGALSGTSPVTLSAAGAIGCATCVTSSGAAAAGNAFFSAAGQAISADTAIVDTTGTLNYTQGTITTSQPFSNHTATFNAAGVAFTNWFSNVTCTAAATSSYGFRQQIGGTDQGGFGLFFAAATCASPMVFLPAPAAGAPNLIGNGTGVTNAGVSLNSGGGTMFWIRAGAVKTKLGGVTDGSNDGILLGSAGGFGISSNASPAAANQDVGLGRNAAGVLSVDTTTIGNGLGRLKAAGYISVGTTFTSNNGCTESALTGGATVGKFTVGQNTACTIVITMGNAATAPNGWSCFANDQTAVPAVAIRQTASNGTTASLLMTVATNDVISFGCVGY